MNTITTLKVVAALACSYALYCFYQAHLLARI